MYCPDDVQTLFAESEQEHQLGTRMLSNICQEYQEYNIKQVKN